MWNKLDYGLRKAPNLARGIKEATELQNEVVRSTYQ